MDIAPVEVLYFQTRSQKCPFQIWLDSLELKLQLIVSARLARIRRGLFGDAKPVGAGVYELKIDFGPGYRIYFGRHGAVVVVLLHAGEKRRQADDIEKAQSYWKDYLVRSNP